MTSTLQKTGLRVRLFFRLPALAIGLALLLPAGSPVRATDADTPRELVTWTEPHMGTVFTIRVWVANNPDETQKAEGAVSLAFQKIGELDQICSDYIASSELNGLHRHDAETPVEISRTLADILQRSRQLSERTDGAFDVTIGPLIRQWRLSRKNSRLPRKQQLDAAFAATGYQNLVLDFPSGDASPTATLRVPGMKLDLGGIAKGSAADAALATLRSHGFPQSLVAASGDIAVGDPPPGKDSWRVGIQGLASDAEPVKEASLPGDLTGLIELSNAAISTSGDLRQWITIDGTRYSHIVDPTTGLGLTRRRSVSVIAPNATDSDSLATACSVLTWDAASSLISDLGGDYAIQLRELDDDGKLIIRQSKNFPAPAKL